MMSLNNLWILILVVSFVFFGCSSSQNSIPDTPTKNAEEAVAESVKDESPDTEIIVFVNDRVKYAFTKQDTSWGGTATQYDSGDPITRNIVTIFKLEPTYGWEDFENMVEFLNIYTMPDQTEIENRKPGEITPNSRSYKITVFDGETTRTYSYFNPEEESANHWQSQQISTFGSYIVTEMKVVEAENE